MEENNYKNLLKKIEGKTYSEVKDIVNNNVEFKNDLGYFQQYIEIQDILDRLMVYDDYNDVTSYLIFKNELIFNSVLANFTNLEVLPEDAGANNHNIYLEMVLKENPLIKNFYDIANEAFARRDNLLIHELNKTLNGLPSIEEIEKLKEEMSHVFDETGEEKLQQINNILEFNDPTLKMIKETINNVSAQEAREKVKEKMGNGVGVDGKAGDNSK